MPSNTERLVRILAAGDPYKLALGATIGVVLEQFPGIPDDVLARITVTNGRDSFDFQTNAALVISGWLKSPEALQGHQ
jgi:hypothetical protein